MSYLDFPRIHFSGSFQTDPSTINNDPEHFDSGNFRPNYTERGAGATNGWWNPSGSAAWRFIDCQVRGVVGPDGKRVTSSALDSSIGLALNSISAKLEGKLVDLDPMQQMVSQIWGFHISVGDEHGGGFRGRFAPVGFADIWTRYPQGQPDSFFSAFYQSALEQVEWFGDAGSPVLRELQAQAANNGNELSVRFVVDGYDDDAGSDRFTLGRVVGIIGPRYKGAEPRTFVAGRRIDAVAGAQATTQRAYAKLDGTTLHLDLGNSLPTTSAGGPQSDVGDLLLQIGSTPVVQIDYLEPNWYSTWGGLVTIELTPEQAESAATSDLALTSTSKGPLLSEAGSQRWLRADGFVFRLDADTEEATTIYALDRGAPITGATLQLSLFNDFVESQVTQGSLPGTNAGTPKDALSWTVCGPTNDQGAAEVKLQAGDPGNPRLYIDGQVYGVQYGIDGEQTPAPASPSDVLNPLIFTGYEIPERPSWVQDVAPIFTQYANLYPVMKPIVDLADYGSVVEKRFILQRVFETSVSDANYMPVTRDLSTSKRTMLQKWLADEVPLYMRLDSVEQLHEALQFAVELEHSTLPPYLYALYSIKPGKNARAAQIIRSVAMEEMLHMSLAANILVSIGGHPKIGHPGFIPDYPGPLPGGLTTGLTVSLRRCSIPQIRDVFMAIEEPETSHELRFRDGTYRSTHGRRRNDKGQFTIGWFYDEVAKALTELSKAGKIEFGHADRQLTTWPDKGELFAITSLDDATRAIDLIKHQGEGARLSPLVDPSEGQHGGTPEEQDEALAHYFRFAGIVYGHEVVVQRGGYAFIGDPISFEEDGVWPVLDDPALYQPKQGSRAWYLVNQFNVSYQNLLQGLHRVFNGEPSYIDEAIGLMYSLAVQARVLVQTPSGRGDGTTLGPTFQVPVPQTYDVPTGRGST